jgi:hypothetical protein
MASPELEIERLLSQIADEGATRESLDQLQALLLDRPDLQDHYARVMGLHTLLKFEFDLSAQRFSPITDVRDAVIVGGQRRSARRRVGRPWMAISAVIAASIAGMLTAGYWLRDWTSAATPIAIRDERYLAAAKIETLALLSDLTHISLSDVTLPARSAVDVGLTLCSGAVWMERGVGLSERGYMVEVPPGATILVAVDADAGVHNALAVVELDASGRPTGSVMSFKNDKKVGHARVLVGGDLIADWSERNNSPDAKYYLFTGTHKPQKSTDRRWHLSDYAVLLSTADMTYLGWDDSGYAAVANPSGGDYYADKDFDDISAIIQIRRADTHGRKNSGITYAPPRLTESTATNRAYDSTCAFTVPPGEKALIKVSSSAGWHNEVEIVDRKSMEVIWRQHFVKAVSDYKGAHLIENNSEEVREYFVTSRHKEWSKPGEKKPWRESSSRLLRDEAPSLVLGFEDGGGDEDFNDVIVHIRRITDVTRIVGGDLL